VDTGQLFTEAMAALASGVTVITARREDGTPCGLAATSTAAFSADPPSVMVSIAHSSRCHDTLAGCERFGVHILGADQETAARVFVSRADDKFAQLDWRWDGDVPELADAMAYLRCRRSETFARYDHSILVGDLEDGRHDHGEPLLYARRRMNWSLK
jgi:flavin reductase (DIM6/NTAB) family NADH-FMN oxidoreductase RutF